MLLLINYLKILMNNEYKIIHIQFLPPHWEKHIIVLLSI